MITKLKYAIAASTFAIAAALAPHAAEADTMTIVS
jgi:hypothetical protein